MAINLKGKIVVISGASAGIGLATAEECAELGATLVLGARRTNLLESAAPTLKRAGAESVTAWPLDVCDQASVDHFYECTEKKFGYVDVLVNNAGLASGVDPVATGKDEDWRAMMETNIYGL